MTDTIATALAAIQPEIADRYADDIRMSYAALVEQFGPAFHGIYNHRSGMFFSNTLRPLCDRTQMGRNNYHYTLNDEKVAAASQAYAEAATMAWLNKITCKLGNVDAARVERLGGCRFAISAKRNGHDLVIQQDIVLKQSPRGTLFNQFPARIYVDGKFTPEAKYKQMFAA
jgi:hypothetical protein